MRSPSRRNVAIATALSVAVVQLLLLTSEAFRQVVPILPKAIVASGRAVHPILSLRGGDYHDDSSSTLDVDVDLDEIESSDEEVDDDEEEEVVQEKLNPKLAQAVQAASSKVKARAVKAATQSAKAAIESTLLTSKPKTKKEKSGLAKFFQLPYIFKACLNPFIFLQMTKEYWWSLFNHKYGEVAKDSSQDLRSSLQDKARKGGGDGSLSSRKKRKMKPGQAKTLSDLPQLNT